MVQPDDEFALPDVAADTAAAIFAATVGAVIAGPVGAVTGAAAGPMMSAAMDDAIRRVQRRRHRRSGEALALAATLSGLTQEELARRIADREGLAELAARVLTFVQDAALAEKRRALAATLARGARAPSGSGDELDRALLLASALATIDGPHIRAMMVMQPYRGYLPEPPNEHLMPTTPIGMTFAEIDSAAGLHGLADPVVRHLIATGLAENVVNGLFSGAERYQPHALTQLGQDALQVVLG